MFGAIASPSTLYRQTSFLDIRAWQLHNEDTVGVNQQQGFTCAAPRAPTKEHCYTNVTSTSQRGSEPVLLFSSLPKCLHLESGATCVNINATLHGCCCRSVDLACVVRKKFEPPLPLPFATPTRGKTTSKSLFCQLPEPILQTRPTQVPTAKGCFSLVTQQTPSLQRGSAWPSQAGGNKQGGTPE